METAELIDLDELLKHPDGLALSDDHPAARDPEHWSVGPVLRSRDSTLLENTNADALLAALKERKDIPRCDWAVHTFDHWGFGWVEQLAFRAKNEDGTPTAVCLFLASWAAALSEYPCADDSAYSRAQYEASLENIADEARAIVRDGAPDDWAVQVWRWLWDNDQEALQSHDDGAAHPPRERLRPALRALALLDPDDEEEDD